MRPLRTRAELALVFDTIIWGATFVVVKQALNDVSPLLFLTLRFTLAAVAMILIFGRHLRIENMVPGVVSGLFLFTGFAFQTFGLRLTTAPKSGFITGFSIALVPLLVACVYKKRPGVSEMAGVLLATAGLGLMTLNGQVMGINRGDMLTIGCALAFAAQIVVVGYYSARVSFESVALWQTVTCAVLALGTFWWLETPFVRVRVGVVSAVLVTGLFATALAFSIQVWAQQYTTATRTALIFALEPVFAWLTSFLLTHEGLSGAAAAGAALILTGILLVELKPIRLHQHPPM